MPAATRKLDPNTLSKDAKDFENSLRAKLVGQTDGISALVKSYQMFCAGMRSPGRPVSNFLFLGPTGTGKTFIVESAATILFGDARSVIKVNCGEFQHSHEIAKLIGSPPGYLGHRETHPVITQEALAAGYTEKLKLSFLLFDEVEKASDALWQLLLGILDKATLTLGDNRKVDLSSTMIFLTSNLGGKDISDLNMPGFGFGPVQKTDNKKIDKIAVNAANRQFRPEFINRIDQMVVFHPLEAEHLERVLDLELMAVQNRILATPNGQVLFRTTKAAKKFILSRGTDTRYGARHLKRAIEELVSFPFSGILASGQLQMGDTVCIDVDNDTLELSFTKDSNQFKDR